MRQLTSYETQQIGAGNAFVAYLAGVATASAGLYLYGLIYNAIFASCKTLYEAHDYTYGITVPVYDALGNYMGDVEQIIKDTEYTPVTVCI